MTIKQLEYFVSVSDNLSFTKAAKQFYISQTAVSLQIRALEDELGVELFTRTNRKVELTTSGKSFLEDARAIIRRTQDACARAKKAETDYNGQLHLGFVKGFEKTILSELLSEFHVQYPNVSLTLTRDNVNELYDGLFLGDIDACINVLFDEMYCEEDMEYLLIKEYPLCAVIPFGHPLSHLVSITREDLRDYPIVVLNKKESRYGEIHSVQEDFVATGQIPNVQCVSDDMETILLAVASGLGYALVPAFIADNLSQREKVISLPVEGEKRMLSIVLAWKKTNTNQLLGLFRDKIIKTAIENGRF